MPAFIDGLKRFTPEQRKAIGIYILGIMFYKFGLEAFNGTIVSWATILFDRDADLAGRKRNTFYQVGVLSGLNQATQCIGAILVAPLIKKMPTRTLLSGAVFIFGLLTAILLIVDGSTGGRFKPDGVSTSNPVYFGRWNSKGIYPIYTISGIAYGTVELIRRVLPRDICGGDIQKLRRMDATVHVLYEVAGTAGAFASTALITDLGNNRSFIITPIFFAAAAICWRFLDDFGFNAAKAARIANAPLASTERGGIVKRGAGYVGAVGWGFVLFGKTLVRGTQLIFGNRHLIWLFPTYSIALYAHRYLENGISPAFARRALGQSQWSQIMVGGSNFGELLGATFVFFFTDFIKTPLPWLRLDALLLFIVWVYVYITPRRVVATAWKLAGACMGISLGWAAGDVSLAAFIQSRLSGGEHGEESDDVSDLGAVMSWLYSAYIILYAILNSQLGKFIDKITNARRPVQDALLYTAGVQFSIISLIIMAATFIPRGSFALNPDLIDPAHEVADVERLGGTVEVTHDKFADDVGDLKGEKDSSDGGDDERRIQQKQASYV